MILRVAGESCIVVGELEHLIVEGRVVGQNLCRIVVDLKTVFDGLHGDGAAPVGDQPVQWGQGQLSD